MAEIRRLIGEMEFSHPVTLVEGRYDTKEFYEMARGLEEIPEGGERCFKCYRLRMEETARLAKTGGYDYFTTTLSISPLKNVQKINEIGEELAEIYEVPHLTSDFKKKEWIQAFCGIIRAVWHVPAVLLRMCFFQKIRETGKLP